ncbi:hypothetical protein JCM11641_002585 [Rhodosporidiobolus odoratus]
MLTQQDVVRLLSKEPPPSQVVVFSILHAYVYSKSSRGNLPSESISKLLSIYRKLVQRNNGHPLSSFSPVSRAFEAIKSQLIIVNRKWYTQGALAFGPLGAIGATGGNPDAQLAWTKATDGKVKVFPEGAAGGAMGWQPGEMDAGRIVDATYQDSADPLASLSRTGGMGAPPVYDGPPPDDTVVNALNERREQDEAGTAAPAGWRDSVDTAEGGKELSGSVQRSNIDEGAAHLARLRLMKEEKERRDSVSPSSASPPIIKEAPATGRSSS